MKTLKILLTVLITLIIVVVGFATEILAVTDLTALNPWFYRTALDEMGFYENIRVLLLNQIEAALAGKESLPEQFKDDAYELAENVLAKNRFSREFGDFFGGSVEYVLSGEGDAVIPLKGWINDLSEEIDDSTLIEDIISYEIEIGAIDEADKDQYYAQFKNLLMNAYTGFMGMFGSLFSSTDNLSDFIKMFTPTKELQDKMEGRFWSIRYWANLANIAAYAGLAAVLLMTALMFVVWRKNVGVAFKIIGILLIVNSAFFLLSGIGLLLSITVAGLLNVIPASILPLLDMIQSLINPLALVALGTGIIVLVLGIILAVIGGALIRKKTEDKEKAAEAATIPSPEISEIEYPSGPDVELVSGDIDSEPETTEAESGPIDKMDEDK